MLTKRQFSPYPTPSTRNWLEKVVAAAGRAAEDVESAGRDPALDQVVESGNATGDTHGSWLSDIR